MLALDSADGAGDGGVQKDPNGTDELEEFGGEGGVGPTVVTWALLLEFCCCAWMANIH